MDKYFILTYIKSHCAIIMHANKQVDMGLYKVLPVCVCTVQLCGAVLPPLVTCVTDLCLQAFMVMEQSKGSITDKSDSRSIC